MHKSAKNRIANSVSGDILKAMENNFENENIETESAVCEQSVKPRVVWFLVGLCALVCAAVCVVMWLDEKSHSMPAAQPPVQVSIFIQE